MEYKYQSSVEGFRVQYTLIVPENNDSSYNPSEEERAFLNSMEEAYDDIERLTNQADGYDYALAVSSGILAGLIDSFFVGAWDFKKAKAITYEEINNKVIDFAKKDSNYIPWCEGAGKSEKWKKRDPGRLDSAVKYLEDMYPLPGDNEWKYKGTKVTASTHHLDDFCHHPTIVGLICSICVQFSGIAKYHTPGGGTVSIPITVNEYGNFASDKPFGKVFAGTINWFLNVRKTIANREGHLMSDMAGSLNSVKKGKNGAGIPGTVMSTLKELSSLPCFKDTSFEENLRKAFQNGIGSDGKKLDLGIFNNLFEGASSKFDLRTELAVKHELKRQAIPVIINEIVVRAFYFIRRFIDQMKVKKSLYDIDWKKLLPMNNRTIVRMMTIASGTFCLTDMGDAAIRAGVKSGGQFPIFIKNFILRVNFVGVGRFTLAVSSDLYMEARKGRMEIATSSGEVAVAAIETKKVLKETDEINKETEEHLKELESINKTVVNNIL